MVDADQQGMVVLQQKVDTMGAQQTVLAANLSRYQKEAEMAAIADMISEVLMDLKNVETITKVRQRVRELTAKFPLPY